MMTEITHKNDVLAEAQAVLDKWSRIPELSTSEHPVDELVRVINGKWRGTLSNLLTYTRSLLEPLGDDGRELVTDLKAQEQEGVFALGLEAAAFIERQSAALAARDERIRVLEAEPTDEEVAQFVRRYAKTESLRTCLTAFVKARALLGEKP